MRKTILYAFAVSMLLSMCQPISGQVDKEALGAWYMYFYDLKFKESKLGVQGDVQFRNWDLGGDLEQLLLRSGLTYRPNEDVKLTLGYGHIISGEYGPSAETSSESRVYQEALLPQSVGERIELTHRFRFEQRFVENQDFRSRYRYALFLTLPITSKKIEKGTYYLSLYNELFINGQRHIGEGRAVEIFDRNRSYVALGLKTSDVSKVQLGVMRQTNDVYGKNQIQLSLHQNF